MQEVIQAPKGILLSPEDLKIFTLWSDSLDGMAGTKKLYRKSIRALMAFMSEKGLTVQDLDKPALIAFKESLSDLSPSTINTYLTAVRSFCGFVSEVTGSRDISKGLKQVKLSKDFKRDALTEKQVTQVLDGIDRSTEIGKRNYAMIALMTCCGLRDCEVVALDLEDIRTKGDRTVAYIKGKGHTEKDRYVRLPEKVETAIREYLKARNRKKTDILFVGTTPRSTSRLRTESVSRIVKNALRNAGLDSPRLTAHSLRHTTATLALKHGTPMREVQQILRHDKAETTAIYAHDLEALSFQGENRVCQAIFGD